MSRPCSTSRLRVLRADRGVLVCETHHGFVCANAGVDRSNVARTSWCSCPRIRTPPRAHCARAWRPRAGAPGRRDLGLLRPGLAPGPDRRGPRLRRPPPARRLARANRRPRIRAARDRDRRGRRRGRGRRPGPGEGLLRARRARARARPFVSGADGPGAAALRRPGARTSFGRRRPARPPAAGRAGGGSRTGSCARRPAGRRRERPR